MLLVKRETECAMGLTTMPGASLMEAIAALVGMTHASIVLGAGATVMRLENHIATILVCRHCSMSSMQHVARCFEMQGVLYSVTLLCVDGKRVALKNTHRVA